MLLQSFTRNGSRSLDRLYIFLLAPEYLDELKKLFCDDDQLLYARFSQPLDVIFASGGEGLRVGEKLTEGRLDFGHELPVVGHLLEGRNDLDLGRFAIHLLFIVSRTPSGQLSH